MNINDNSVYKYELEKDDDLLKVWKDNEGKFHLHSERKIWKVYKMEYF